MPTMAGEERRSAGASRRNGWGHTPHLVIMGVSGSGKTTVAEAVLARLPQDWVFAEADDFHPEQNKTKMAAGHPLTDADRQPWLRALHRWTLALAGQHKPTIITCSALRREYRDVLADGLIGTQFLHLHGPRALLASRMSGRSGHFMPTSLLDSQLATLEPLQQDEPGMELRIEDSVAALTDQILAVIPPAYR